MFDKSKKNPSCKVGDILQLVWIAPGQSVLSDTKGGYYNHYIGDVGTVIKLFDGYNGQHDPLVHVAGRYGTGYAGNTLWDKYTRYINLTRQRKIDNILGM